MLRAMPHPWLSRRVFLGAIAAIPIGSLAQAPPDKRKVLGYLSGGQGPEWLWKVVARRGYAEERNLRIETRIPPDWEGATLKRAAEELVALRPDALYALHGNRVAALAAATKTIPIVCGGMADPVGGGFAKSLRRPGGNVTGLSFGFPESAEIQIGLLKAIRPSLRRVGGLFHASIPPEMRGIWWVEACRKSAIEWHAASFSGEKDLATALAPLSGEAVFVAPTRNPKLAAKAHDVATSQRTLSVGGVEEGALMNYGLDHADHDGRIATMIDQVLRGVDPAGIPFELPDRPSFAFNRATARALGIEVPREVLLRVTQFVG